jgi:hypothetical protein
MYIVENTSSLGSFSQKPQISISCTDILYLLLKTSTAKQNILQVPGVAEKFLVTRQACSTTTHTYSSAPTLPSYLTPISVALLLDLTDLSSSSQTFYLRSSFPTFSSCSSLMLIHVSLPSSLVPVPSSLRSETDHLLNCAANPGHNSPPSHNISSIH